MEEHSFNPTPGSNWGLVNCSFLASCLCTILTLSPLDTWLYYWRPISFFCISFKPGLQESDVPSLQVSPSLLKAADLVLLCFQCSLLGKETKTALARISLSFQGSFSLTVEGTWELNVQFPQTISKKQEPKCSSKRSVSLLVHAVLYFQPCMKCSIAGQCTLYATLNTGRNKVIL